MQLQTKQQRPGETTPPPDMEFLFIEGDRVVGCVTADCANCAWNEGHPRWPLAVMAYLRRELLSQPFPLTCISIINRDLKARRQFAQDREKRN